MTQHINANRLAKFVCRESPNLSKGGIYLDANCDYPVLIRDGKHSVVTFDEFYPFREENLFGGFR